MRLIDIRICLAVVIGTGMGQAAPAGHPLTLVENGKSTYAICTSSRASLSEKHAAEELQRFIEEISGARLPIVDEAKKPAGQLILVGRSTLTDKLKPAVPFDKLGAEGFVIRTEGQRLVIAGGGTRGTLYGVYGFLDKLGCRWYTRDVSRMPKLSTLRIEAMNETGKPAFEYREPFFLEAQNRDWAARNRINGASMDLDEARGGKVRYYPFVHSFYDMIPPAKYFDAHPEYFSLVAGKRVKEYGQLCLTNPDLLRESVKNVLAWIKEHPEAGIYSVSQNDWTGWCECERCRKVEEEEGGVHSGPLVRFVNAVAAEVEKQYPDRLIDTLAYWYTEDPPSQVKPRPNVRIRLCPIGTCDAHPYEQCPRDAYFMNNLRAWSKITGQLYIWHYNTNFAHYLLPFPDFDELAADIPMYQKNGVVGIFLEGSPSAGGGAEGAELRSYLMARLLWDTRVDVNKEIDGYLEAVYGKAAGAMREYIDLMHQQVRQGNHVYIYMHPQSPYLRGDFAAKARGILERAAAQTDNEAARRRVRHALLSIDYLDLARAKKYNINNGVFAPENLDGVKARFADLVETARSFGITEFREGRPMESSIRDFYENMKPYGVATIENDRWRVDTIPEFAGRIVRMIDKRTGRNAIHEPDPGDWHYPHIGSSPLTIYPDYRGFENTEIRWDTVPEQSKSQLVYSGTTKTGLKVRRTVSFDAEGAVRTEIVIENGGAEPRQLVAQARLDIGAGSIADANMVYRKRSGGAVERKVLVPEKPPAGIETLTGADCPDAQWSVVKQSAQWRVQFRNEEIARTDAEWSDSYEGVRFSAWTPRKTLAPKETMRFEVRYTAQ